MNNVKIAEQLQAIAYRAKKEEAFKMRLLQDTKSVIEEYQLQLDGANLIVEDVEGYDLYFALELNKADLEVINSDEDSGASKTFTEQHFMDCHRY